MYQYEQISAQDKPYPSFNAKNCTFVVRRLEEQLLTGPAVKPKRPREK